MVYIHLEKSQIRLPKSHSDQSWTSTMVTNDDGNLVLSINLFGGCRAPYEAVSQNLEQNLSTVSNIQYSCSDVSDANLVLAPQGEIDRGTGVVPLQTERHERIELEERSPMPRPRYRHASVAIDGKVWIIGGRDSNDEIIHEIDVYDEINDEWVTLDNGLDSIITHEKDEAVIYGVSDHCAFSSGPYLFITGGFDRKYKAVSHTIMIDTEKSFEHNMVEYTVQAPLNVARGGCGAIKTINNIVIVAGGFTHKDGFCEAMRSAEVFDAMNNKWDLFENSMVAGRAKPNLTYFDHKVFAFGGERRGVFDEMNGHCDGDPHSKGYDVDKNLPNRLTYPVDEVEVIDNLVYSNEIGNSYGIEWEIVQERIRQVKGFYRYVAAPLHSEIFFIGGIKNRESKIHNLYKSDKAMSCSNCFEQSNKVLVFDAFAKKFDTYLDQFASWVLVTIASITFLSFLLYRRRLMTSKKLKEDDINKRGLLMLTELNWNDTDEKPV